MVWLTDERRLALFPAGTTVRYPHRRESPTRREQDLNLRRTWVQALLNEVFNTSLSCKIKTDIIIGISPPILYRKKIWFLSYRPKCCSSIILQDSLKCNIISRKKGMIKFIYGIQISIQTIWYCHFGCALPDSLKVPRTWHAHLCNISKKHGWWSCFFCLHINTKFFCKLAVSFWVCVVRHTQSTQINKFAISL